VTQGRIYLLLAVLSFASGQLQAQSPGTVTLVKTGRLLDPRTGNVLAPAAVLVEDGKIKEVGSPSQLQAHAPAGFKTIDLGSATLLPGLIDGHTHLFLNVIVLSEAEQDRHYNGLFAPELLLAVVESPTKRALMAAQSAREDLESGITTVRNLGHSGVDGDTELRDAINAGRIPGPRILAAGRKLDLQDGQKDLAREYAEKALALLDSHSAPLSSWSDTAERRAKIRQGIQDALKKLGQAQR
jgi:imidazolonepropionase-like amidohydrolase